MDFQVFEMYKYSVLCFIKSAFGLHGYVETDMTGGVNGRNSTTRFIYIYTLDATTVSWFLKL